jgi:hypothetical protein
MTLVVELPSAQTYAELSRDVSSLSAIIDEQTAVAPDDVWMAVAAAAEGKLPFACEVRLVAGSK